MSTVSFIFPVYNEEENLPKLFLEILKIKQRLQYDVEVIFIDDNSKDGSIQLLKDIAKEHSFVKIVSFSRNFGHQIAITAGLDFAFGDAIIIMDSDLQDPPEVILDLIKKWEDGYDVVYAQRKSRKDTLFKRITAYLFYRLLTFSTDIDIPKDTGDFRLMDKKVVHELKKCKEKSRFMRGLTSFVGFKQTSVLFDRNERFAGQTNYPLKKMIQLSLDGLTGFSIAPLRIISYVGFITAFFSFIGIVYAISMKFLFPEIAVSGWTMMIISIFLIGGVQIVILGIIGEYIGRIYIETQNRPLYIIKEKINFKEDEK